MVSTFIHDKHIQPEYIEETDRDLIIKHPTCRILILKPLLETNLLVGNVELTLNNKTFYSDFWVDINDKIKMNNILLVVSAKTFQNLDLPPKCIGDLLHLKLYNMTPEAMDGPIMLAIVSSKNDLLVYDDHDMFEKIEGGIYSFA